MMVDITRQTIRDNARIDELMAEAFGVDRFSRSVWALRSGPAVPELSLVIRDAGQMVGSLRFWEIMLGNQKILLLGPLAVSPQLRGKGYGKALVEDGLRRARTGDWPLVLVSGEIDYYPRLGFVPAAPYNLQWPGFIEQERLQFFELREGALAALPSGPLAVMSVHENLF